MDRVGAEVIAFRAIITFITFIVAVVMMVAMRAMHVLVGDFFFGGGAHIDHFQFEAQGHAGQWMVAIQDHFVFSDFGHGENHHVVVFAAFRQAFELHADFQRLRQARPLFHFQQVRVVIAKGVFRFNLERGGVAVFLAVQFFFDLGQGVLVATVQVNHRLATVFDQIVLCVGQFVFHRHNGILGDLH